MHELTAPHSSVQNGVAERYNRSLLDRARTLLDAAGLPLRFWGEAVMHASAVLNSVCRTTASESPAAAVLGVAPDLAQFHAFGSEVWVHDSSPVGGKLGPRGVRGTYLGGEGPLSSGSYRVLVDGRIIISCDVTFLDRQAPPARSSSPRVPDGALLADKGAPVDESTDQLGEAAVPTRAKDPPLHTPHGEAALPVLPPSSSAVIPRRVRFQLPGEAAPAESALAEPLAPARVPCSDDLLLDEDVPDLVPFDDDDYSDAPAALSDAPAPRSGPVTRSHTSALRVAGLAATVSPTALAPLTPDTLPVPRTVLEALAGDDAADWQRAIDAELAAMHEHECWQMVPLPAGAHAVGSRFVFARKRDGSFKARLVAKGFSQRPGVDFDDTYAPVSTIATLRCFVARVVLQDQEWTQLDFASAFLNGKLDRVVYMRPPPGCTFGPQGYVCALSRAIYGLCQAGHHWHAAIRTKLVEAGFVPTDADPCLFVLVLAAGGRVILLLYVDDGLLSAPTTALLDEWRARIMGMYRARDMGEPSDFLGIQAERERDAGTVRLHQRPYIESLALRYPSDPARPPSVPLPSSVLLADGELLNAAQLEEYPSLVGALNYIACCTRPDVSQAVSTLSRFLKRPRLPHYLAALRVLHYLVGTAELALVYSRAGGEQLIGFCDADFAGDPVSRRSTTGFAFIWAGAAISWKSKLQPTVALSTTESELQAASEAGRDKMWFRHLLPAIGGGTSAAANRLPFGAASAAAVRGPSAAASAAANCPPSAANQWPTNAAAPTLILSDSQSALALVKNAMTTQRAKHIDVIHHFARERVARGELRFAYVGTAENIADCLTKPVPLSKLLFCRTGLGLV